MQIISVCLEATMFEEIHEKVSEFFNSKNKTILKENMISIQYETLVNQERAMFDSPYIYRCHITYMEEE